MRGRKMKKKSILTILPFAAIGLAACGGGGGKDVPSGPKDDDKAHIVILAGQSGARGKAVTSDLTAEQKIPNPEVDIMADGLTMPALVKIPQSFSPSTILQPVKPGLGDGAGEFGPELGLGEILATRYKKPDAEARKAVIVKYTACGSTFTDHWYSKSMLNDAEIEPHIVQTQIHENPRTGEATGPLTDNLYQLIDYAKETIESEGFDVVIDGVVWVHGEQDAKETVNMDIYEKALGYWIDDIRSYVGNKKLPVVITEAVTNSARYSNKLRDIQEKVAEEKANCLFVDTDDLYSNTFEPWHFGAKSNFDLGRRAGAELIALNDTRKFVQLVDDELIIPSGDNDALPDYLNAQFENGDEGLVKVEYKGEIDPLGEEEQTISFKIVGTNQTGNVKVNMNPNECIVDGKDKSEYKTYYSNPSDPDFGSYSFKAGSQGIYVYAQIKDGEVWTDGENWKVGDMGQFGENDDLRVYFATDDASQRITAALSAASLLRLYKPGTVLSANVDPRKNMIYTKEAEEAKYKALTHDEVNVANDGEETTSFEMFIPFSALGVTSADNLKLLVAYNDVSKSGTTKTNVTKYFKAGEGALEEDIANYVSIAE